MLLGLFGLIYLLRSEFMPYYAQAVSREGSAVEPSLRVLFLALMKLVGSGWLASALAMFILLLIPFRKGSQWAYWAVSIIGLTTSVPTFIATLYVGQHTPASPLGYQP